MPSRRPEGWFEDYADWPGVRTRISCAACGFGALHAVFLEENRTRDRVQRSVQEIRGTRGVLLFPSLLNGGFHAPDRNHLSGKSVARIERIRCSNDAHVSS